MAELEAHERAKLGLFLAFQYPTAIPGVTMANFLRLAVSSVRDDGTSESATTPLIPMRDFRRELKEKMKKLGIDDNNGHVDKNGLYHYHAANHYLLNLI